MDDQYERIVSLGTKGMTTIMLAGESIALVGCATPEFIGLT